MILSGNCMRWRIQSSTGAGIVAAEVLSQECRHQCKFVTSSCYVTYWFMQIENSRCLSRSFPIAHLNQRWTNNIGAILSKQREKGLSTGRGFI